MTWAAGAELRRVLPMSRAWAGAMGSSRRLLFLGAAGCSCWLERLTIFWDGVLCLGFIGPCRG